MGLFFLISTVALGSGPNHDFSFSFRGAGDATLGDPNGIAVDNSGGASAGDIYVADRSAYRVEKFDPSGNFILMFGDEVNQTTGGDVCTAASGHACRAGRQAPYYDNEPPPPPGAFSFPTFVAVDSSGAVYVGDGGTERVSKFNSGGQLVTSWGVGGSIQFDSVLGLATGASGQVFVLAFDYPLGEYPPDGTVFTYNQAGGLTSTVVVADQSYEDRGLAVDPSGNLFRFRNGDLLKFSPGGTEIGAVDSVGYGSGLGIDPGNGRVFVAKPGQVEGFSASCALPNCAPLDVFGAGYLKTDFFWGFRGIGVNGANHTVYVADGNFQGPGEVAVFRSPGVLPEAVTGAAEKVEETSAEATGYTDPAGAGPITGCRFEYLEDAGYYLNGYAGARSEPCAQGSPGAASGVTARLAGLKPGTSYRMRLVVNNAAGPRTGFDRVFRTPNFPRLLTGPARDVTPSSGTLVGHIEPAVGASAAAVRNCRFAYVEQRQYAEGGYLAAKTAPCEPGPPYPSATNVSARLEGLSPGTIYRYRIVAQTDDGDRAGDERAFVTAPEELVVPPPERGKREDVDDRVRCSKSACSRVLDGSDRPRTWRSPGFPKGYGWLFSIYKKGKSLPHTKPVDGCISTFRGRGMIATLNGCKGRFRLTYIGRGKFKVRWRVFEYCRCADSAERRG